MPSPFLERALRVPSYGWTRDGELYKPTNGEILREWLGRLNLLRSRKAWLSVTVWGFTLALLPFGAVFLLHYFSWPLMLAGFLYSMVWLGTHGTVYLHRFGTHRAFTFRNRYYRFVCQNLAIKIVPEEVYIVSHHVHHAYSDLPGDPYNAQAGWLYCFLAGDIHQQINPALSRPDYVHVAGLLKHTGVTANSYEQYQSWGSVTHPARLLTHYLLNWAFWYGAFYLLGGHALATAMFGWAAVWGIGIRAHNYDLHAGGKDRREDGLDFDRDSLAVNRLWPGFVAGEWHNNHHLFPTSVQAGFLPWQFDTAFTFIRFYKLIGGVSSWRNFKDKFYERHYRPHRSAALAARQAASSQTSSDIAGSDVAGSDAESSARLQMPRTASNAAATAVQSKLGRPSSVSCSDHSAATLVSAACFVSAESVTATESDVPPCCAATCQLRPPPPADCEETLISSLASALASS